MRYCVFFLLGAALFCVMALACAACVITPLYRAETPQPVLLSGVCEGTGRGLRGPINVRVRMEDGAITGIEIVESGEDPFVGGAAMEELLELVLMYNSTDLDAVSGATESSKGFLAAVENAMMNYE